MKIFPAFIQRSLPWMNMTSHKCFPLVPKSSLVLVEVRRVWEEHECYKVCGGAESLGTGVPDICHNTRLTEKEGLKFSPRNSQFFEETEAASESIALCKHHLFRSVTVLIKTSLFLGNKVMITSLSGSTGTSCYCQTSRTEPLLFPIHLNVLDLNNSISSFQWWPHRHQKR